MHAWWDTLVAPSESLVEAADRDRARMLAVLLLLLLVGGLTSGWVQLLLVANFAPTFRVMSVGLAGVSLAYALSRTKHYRAAALLASTGVIAACVAVGLRSPDDRVWYAFMMIGVLLASSFLSVRAAAAVALLAFATVAFTVVATGAAAAPRLGLPPLIFHAVFSPLMLLLSRQGAKIAARRSEQLQERERELLEVRRLETLGRLASGVAHDFNNLLAIVLANVEFLLSRKAFDEHQLHEIRVAGERAAGLVRQLAGFARRQPAEPRAVNLNDVLVGIEPILRRLIGDRVTLTIDHAPALPEVTADPVEIEQVVLNLVVNARDAMPDGGELRVATGVLESTAASKRGVLLRVDDSGIGMDAATQASIFEPFFTTKARDGGHGLGLAIVHGIVTRAGGGIRVQSEVGHGTTFEVTLPCATATSVVA